MVIITNCFRGKISTSKRSIIIKYYKYVNTRWQPCFNLSDAHIPHSNFFQVSLTPTFRRMCYNTRGKWLTHSIQYETSNQLHHYEQITSRLSLIKKWVNVNLQFVGVTCYAYVSIKVYVTQTSKCKQQYHLTAPEIFKDITKTRCHFYQCKTASDTYAIPMPGTTLTNRDQLNQHRH